MISDKCTMRTSCVIKSLNIWVAKHIFLVHVNAMWVLDLFNRCPPCSKLSFPESFSFMVPLSQSFVFTAEGRTQRVVPHLFSGLGLEIRLHHSIDTALLQTSHLALPTAQRTGKEGGLETLIRSCKTCHSLQIFSSFLPVHILQLNPPPKRDNAVSSSNGIKLEVQNCWITYSSLYIKSMDSSGSLSTKMKSYLAPTHPMVEKGNKSLWSREFWVASVQTYCEPSTLIRPWVLSGRIKHGPGSPWLLAPPSRINLFPFLSFMDSFKMSPNQLSLPTFCPGPKNAFRVWIVLNTFSSGSQFL